MKFAVSNIALPPYSHFKELVKLGKMGLQGIEVAPSRVWKETWKGLSAKMVTQYRADVERQEKSEVFELLASSEKLRAISGWSPKIKLADGLERTVNWWRKAFAQDSVRRDKDYLV